MSAYYRIKTIVFPSGERMPLLLNRSTGVPCFDSNMFVLATARNCGKSTSTMQQMLRAISVLQVYLRSAGIDLKERMLEGCLLTLEEVEGLVNFCKLHLSEMQVEDRSSAQIHTRQKNVVSLERVRMAARKSSPFARVKNETVSVRLLYIRNYIRHLANARLLKIDPLSSLYSGLKHNLDLVLELIEERTPERHGDSGEPRIGLEPKALERFKQLIDPSGPDMLWNGRHVKRRNKLLLQWFLRLGLRRGELANIKIKNIDFTSNMVSLHRSADDPKDPRKDQPKAKTLARMLPLDEDLAQLTREYIVLERSRIAGAKKHNFLFVATGSGAPMALRTVNEIFVPFKSKWPEVFDDLSPHVLRYTFNDEYSRHCTAQKIDAKEEAETRRMLNGWTHGSKMPMRYTRRSTRERANAESLRMQKNMTRKKH